LRDEPEEPSDDDWRSSSWGLITQGKAERPKEYLPFPDETLRPQMPRVLGKDYPKSLLD